MYKKMSRHKDVSCLAATAQSDSVSGLLYFSPMRLRKRAMADQRP
jgi:hypothetical protein